MASTENSQPPHPVGSLNEGTCRVVVLDGLDRAAVRETLAARLPQVVPGLADTLPAALEQDGAILVVMVTPEQSLSACLAEAGDAAQALAGWTARQRDLLALQRRNRRRLTLVDAALLTRADDAAWSVLVRRLGGTTVQLGALLTLPSPDAAQAMFRLAAIALGQRNAEAAGVIAELDAATLGRTEGDETRVVLEAVQDWHNRRNELELLRENLAAQMEMNEQTALERADQQRMATSLEERLQVLLTERKDALEALAKAEESASDLAERQALLERNITLQLGSADNLTRQHTQESVAMQKLHEAALKGAFSKATSLEERLQVLLTERKDALESLAKAEESAAALAERQALLEENVSLQLEAADILTRQHAQETVAMREAHEVALNGAFSEAAQARQMVQIEKTAREGQARLARDTLSRRDAVLGAQLLTEAHTIALLRSDLSQVASTLDAATEARDRLDTQTKEQKALIDALSQELDRVYGSKSWRVTGPLRAAMTRLGRP